MFRKHQNVKNTWISRKIEKDAPVPYAKYTLILRTRKFRLSKIKLKI